MNVQVTPRERAANAAVAFMHRWSPASAWVLTAIHPDDGYIVTKGFAPDDGAAARSFVLHWGGRRNLYFQVNPDLRPVADISRKGRKEHIASVVALHVDIDIYKDGLSRDEVLDQLVIEPPSSVPGPPSAINDSGNGVHAFWLLREPVPVQGNVAAAEAVERFNRGLAVAFGGDSTTDVSRILRLPFTLNLPNEGKRQRGLTPVLAKTVSFSPTLRYDLDQFPSVDGKSTRPVTLANEALAEAVHIGQGVTVDDLDQLQVPDRTKTIIALGGYGDEVRSSRSEWLWSVILSMVRCGEPDETILGVVTDPRWRISDCALDKPDPDEFARRQIVRAHAWLSSQLRDDFDD